MKNLPALKIIEELEKLFPEAKGELNSRNTYELCVAVILSAQSTDVSVNQVTPALFEAYPTLESLAKAELNDVESYIARLGLYRAKAKNIIGFAQVVIERFDGVIPSSMEDLTSLPGVGRKCANVIQGECFHLPSLAVDTHVSRIAKRLGLAYQKDSVAVIERKLKKKLPKEKWTKAHHQMIFFGRYLCQAKKPRCYRCPFVEHCHEKNKNLIA
ncbi:MULTISPECIES: endonuclease III [Terrabacteria group]|uniref:endonuclease III n=1 Tax=Bacillati TaxID=1783272 RepID=UPI001C6E59E2|nr:MULTISPECIES: endonuclease III [Terrabacteria group]MBW9212087.1 endonuclease III [Trueperella sp. zg.1013]